MTIDGYRNSRLVKRKNVERECPDTKCSNLALTVKTTSFLHSHAQLPQVSPILCLLRKHTFKYSLLLKYKIYEEALISVRAFLSSNLRCFLRRITLKRSKSVRAFLRATCWRFLCHAEFFQASSTPASIHISWSLARRAPRGRPLIVIGQSLHLERGTDWRDMASDSSEEGPSTRTLNNN